jgi:hypothetical protein
MFPEEGISGAKDINLLLPSFSAMWEPQVIGFFSSSRFG